MKNGRTFFLLLMGMVATLYTAFVVIGQDAPAAEEKGGEAIAASMEESGEDSVFATENDEVFGDPPAEVVAEGASLEEEPVEESPTEEADSGEAAPEEAQEAPVEVVEEEPIEVVGEEDVPLEDIPVEEVPLAGEEVFVAVQGDEGDIPGAEAEKEDELGKISISLDDVAMADVVRMFTRISGANIIASPSNLQGRVTANLDDVQWQSAMETILDMNSLSLTESPPGSKIYRIDPKLPGAPEPMKVKTFFLRYAQVSNSASVVIAMLAPGATLQPFPSRNAMVVRSTSSNLGEIQEIIDAIDVLRDQVFIEAKFMELNDSAIKDLGINWQVLQGYNVSVGSMAWRLSEERTWNESRDDSLSRADNRAYDDTLTQTYDMDGVQYEDSTTTYEEAPPGSGVYVPTTTITPTREVTDNITKSQDITTDVKDTYEKTISDVRTAVLGADDFRLVLSALKQMNGVQIVSNPKLIVANEETATIHIGQVERPFEAVVTPATQVEASTTKYTPGAPINFGVSLEVTPTINTASNITVTIMPELTRFVVNKTAPDGATYPVVASKKIKTMFCLESGKTVAIGGLTETIEKDATKKIPLLGDIPLIGKYLFSHTHKEKQQQETIIFVTVGLADPGSVNEYDGLPEDTELAHQKLLQKRLKRYKFHEQLEEDREELEAQLQESERVRSHLMRSK